MKAYCCVQRAVFTRFGTPTPKCWTIWKFRITFIVAQDRAHSVEVKFCSAQAFAVHQMLLKIDDFRLFV